MDIFEFADKLRVSPTTVSRAISGKGRISAKTREMVLSQMSDFGYVPNPCAQQIATGRSRMVALHLPDKELMSDGFTMQMIRGLQKALHEHGCALVLDSSDESDKMASPLSQWVSAGAIDGVVLVTGDEESVGQAMERASVQSPYVVYTHIDGLANVTVASQLPYIGSVVLDTDWGAREVARMLVGLGHRRIGYVRSSHLPDGVELGFRDELNTLGVHLCDDLVLGSGATLTDGVLALRQLMSKPSPPTAVFARNDEVASGVLVEAKSMGIRVPADLSIVGYDDVPYASLLDPSLTTVRVDCIEIGRLIVDILFSILDSSETGSRIRHLRPSLVMRDSVAVV